MTTGQILLAIITGLAVNECCDVSPWLARKLVRWSAYRRYIPPARAELRAEELAAYLDDRPGKLFKLLTALAFAAAVVVTRKVSFSGSPPSPLWWPTTLTVPVDYQEPERFGYSNASAVRAAWWQLTEEVRYAARRLGVGSRPWRRCVKELERITGDDRWMLVTRNLNLLEEINKSCSPSFWSAAGTAYGCFNSRVPTDLSVTHYQAAVVTARVEIRRLTSDFLLNLAAR